MSGLYLPRVFLAAGASLLSLCCASVPQTVVPPIVPPLVESFRAEFPGEAVRTLLLWHDRIVWATRGGEVRAFDPANKSFAWTWQGPGPCAVPPAESDAALVVLNGTNALTCLDREGHKRWSVDTADPISRGPLVIGARVVVATNKGDLIGIDLESAAEKWRIPGEGALPAALGRWWGHLLVAASDGRIRIVNEEGGLTGNFDGGGGEAPAGSLFVDQDRVFLSGGGGKIAAATLRTQKRDWVMEVGGALAAEGAASGKNLFVPVDNGALFSLRPGSGEVQWWRALPSRTAFRTVLWNGRVLQAVSSLALTSYDPETGAPAVIATLTAEIRTAPLPLDGGLYVAAYEGDTGRGFLIFLKEKQVS